MKKYKYNVLRQAVPLFLDFNEKNGTGSKKIVKQY